MQRVAYAKENVRCNISGGGLKATKGRAPTQVRASIVGKLFPDTLENEAVSDEEPAPSLFVSHQDRPAPNRASSFSSLEDQDFVGSLPTSGSRDCNDVIDCMTSGGLTSDVRPCFSNKSLSESIFLRRRVELVDNGTNGKPYLLLRCENVSTTVARSKNLRLFVSDITAIVRGIPRHVLPASVAPPPDVGLALLFKGRWSLSFRFDSNEERQLLMLAFEQICSSAEVLSWWDAESHDYKHHTSKRKSHSEIETVVPLAYQAEAVVPIASQVDAPMDIVTGQGVVYEDPLGEEVCIPRRRLRKIKSTADAVLTEVIQRPPRGTASGRITEVPGVALNNASGGQTLASAAVAPVAPIANVEKPTKRLRTTQSSSDASVLAARPTDVVALASADASQGESSAVNNSTPILAAAPSQILPVVAAQAPRRMLSSLGSGVLNVLRRFAKTSESVDGP